MWSLRIKDDPENVELLLSLLNKAYPDKFGVSTFEGHDLYLFKGEGLASFALAQAFTVHENKLMWGSIPAIQNALVGMEENLSNDEAFMRAKGLVTDRTNGFIFIDMQKMLVVVKQYLLPMLTTYLAGTDFDMTKIPSDDVLATETIPFAAMIAVDDNEMRFRSKGFFNMSSFFAMAVMRLVRKNLESIGKAVKKKRDMRSKKLDTEEVEDNPSPDTPDPQ